MDSNPCSPPAARPDSTTTGIAGPYGVFRQNGGLKNALISTLLINAMLVLFGGVLTLLDIKQKSDDDYWLTDEPTKLDQIINLTGGAHILFVFVLIIILAAWINRSCKNGWLLDAPHMKTTPEWSVGYFFIPVLMLWKPYGAMKEIRRASFGNDHSLKSLLPLWWTFWLLSSFLVIVTSALRLGADNQASHLTACKLALVSAPVHITLSYLAIALVTSITAAQYRRAEQWKV